MSSSLLYFLLFSTANNAICQRFISQCLLVPRQHVRQLRSSQPAVQNACAAVSLMALPCACAFRYMSYCGAHGALQAAATSGGGQVVFCSLAGRATASDVTLALVQALGARVSEPTQAGPTALRALGALDGGLLVLDCFDDAVAAAADTVQAWLDAAPRDEDNGFGEACLRSGRKKSPGSESARVLEGGALLAPFLRRRPGGNTAAEPLCAICCGGPARKWCEIIGLGKWGRGKGRHE